MRFSARGGYDEWTAPIRGDSGVLRSRKELKRWLGQQRAAFYRKNRHFVDRVWPMARIFHRHRSHRMAGK